MAIAYPPVCCTALCALLWATPVAAATFLVDSTEDAVSATPGDGACADSLGRCTLRAAVQEANALGGTHTIVLPAGVYTLAIPGNNEHFAATGDLDLRTDITVISQDLDPNTTIVDGGGLDRVFQVTNGANAVISHLTIRNGVAGPNALGHRAGGGIAANGINTRVTIDSCIIFGNRAHYYGGGIDISHAYGVIRNTTVASNRTDFGGGIGIGLAGYVEIYNSTLSQNMANTYGGGLFTSNLGATLNNVTIVHNWADANNDGEGSGGGIHFGYSLDNVMIRNSLIAANIDQGGEAPDCSSPLLSSRGHNLIGNTTGCNFVPMAGDITGDAMDPVDPRLGPYARKGGLTPSFALRSDSPALNAGHPGVPGSGGSACEVLDQRGLPRAEHGLCDMGAYQRAQGGQTLVVNSTVDAVDANRGDGSCATSAGVCTLRAAIEEANALLTHETIVVPAGIYTLAIPGGNEFEAATGDLDINNDLRLLGAGPGTTVIDGGGLDRVFQVRDGSEVLISGVTVRNGHASTSNSGGGIYNDAYGILDISDCEIIGNTAGGNGGGVFSLAWAELTVTDCVIRGNTAGNYGGGIANFTFASATVHNTTIDGNQAQVGGGFMNSFLSDAAISGSTLSNNEASGAGGGIGMHFGSGTLTLSNSTLSGNLGGLDGGGGLSLTGSDTARLRNVTITANSSRNGDGGGIAGEGVVQLRNSIVAGNLDPGGQAPDCSATIQSEGHNLLGDDTGCSFLADNGDLWGTGEDPIAPLLDVLADNGGPTWTHAPFLDSPVLDAGNPAVPSSGDMACEATDQRGVDRNLSIRCDMGALERLRADLSITGSLSPGQVDPSNGVRAYLNVTNHGPDTATGAVLSGILPDGATLLDIIGANWTCEAFSGTVTCSHGTVLPGSRSTLEIQFIAPDSSGTMILSASVNPDVLDPDTSNNSVQVSGTVTALPLAMDLPGDPEPQPEPHPEPQPQARPGAVVSLQPSATTPPPQGEAGDSPEMVAEPITDPIAEADPEAEAEAEQVPEPLEQPAEQGPRADSSVVVPGRSGATSGVQTIVARVTQGLAPPPTGKLPEVVNGRGIKHAYPRFEAALWDGLDQLREELDDATSDQEAQTLLSGTVKGVGLLLLAGITNWYLKAATLLAGLLSALPLWMRFDPLPVLLVSEQERRRRELEAERMRHVEERSHRGIGRLLDSGDKRDEHVPTEGSPP